MVKSEALDYEMNLKLSPIPINRVPGGSDDKESAWNAGDLGSISGLRRSPGEGIDNPLQYSCLENSMDREVLVGYSPYSCKELDITEQLTLWLSHQLAFPSGPASILQNLHWAEPVLVI